MSKPRPIPTWMNQQIDGSRPQQVNDLNDALIENADGPDVSLRDIRKNHIAHAASVEVIFTNLTERLCAEIERWPAVIGCAAWLTEPRVLSALATRKFLQMLVQKEDFLRPDSGETDATAKESLTKLYARLPVGSRMETPGVQINHLSYSCDPILAPIRCVGIRPNESKSRTFPRMHHKFLVFCSAVNRGTADEDSQFDWQPEAVWTGSFNPTRNGSRSLENAVIITSRDIAKAYAEEHYALLAVSEPLNWSDSYVAPEYRLGT